MREATIATSLLIDFLGFLGRRGLDAEMVCRAAQIDPDSVSEPNSRVPASAMERLWAAAEQLTGDADLGLNSAESYNPGALGIVGYVILSCRSAEEALERLARYAPLLNDGLGSASSANRARRPACSARQRALTVFCVARLVRPSRRWQPASCSRSRG